jgi:subtilisin family serine protease
VNAAGNNAQQHWSGQFSSSTEYHYFAPGDVGNSVNVPDGQQLCAALKWDDWPSSDQDYDLYVFLPGDSFAYLSSENAQTGSQTPTELVCVTNTSGSRAPYHIVIRKAGATKTPRFDLFITVGDLEYSVASGSLPEPASSPAAFAVGSICPKDDALMFYSSQGPNIANLTKPNIVALGHVSSGAGTFGKLKSCNASNWNGGFAGTSAAAPHVAGAAALLKQAHPNLTVADLKIMLESKVKDLGPPGKDNQYGAGKLWLGTPPTPLLQFDPDWLKIKIKQASDSLAAEFEATAKKCDRCTVGWLFGDGESATGSLVRHTYRGPGWYRVSAHFTDPPRAGSRGVQAHPGPVSAPVPEFL